MRIIPAIDIIDGKCVRLTKGDYDTKKVYNESPVEVAKAFEGAGLTHVHVVDLDGARAKHIVNAKVLEQIAMQTSLQVDFGGGIKSETDLQTAFDCGASQVTLGSIAVSEPELVGEWLEKFGAEQLILGADAKDRRIATHGWEETSDLDVIDFVKDYQKIGVSYVICTDVSKDGMLAGPSFALYQELLNEVPNIKLIASGGISAFSELPQLAAMGCEGVIIGKAIYENRISLKTLEKYILNPNAC
ncbi:MAG: 1-(5-phosphoribosyl)-5-[(5-phosphoribosylamino)methylideneamino]imidazole-4-carboxamide isomerase [Flavobacteriaceae bacterium]|nr:1-(5-phosphoribosyl)-5-[(5-phosphoribosylamino)methylideneamino]imidazole-4-carboxamide isomerase [Flavobacteriaceae bacterium]